MILVIVFDFKPFSVLNFSAFCQKKEPTTTRRYCSQTLHWADPELLTFLPMAAEKQQ